MCHSYDNEGQQCEDSKRPKGLTWGQGTPVQTGTDYGGSMTMTMGNTCGTWILIDLLNQDQMGLLSIGQTSFHGASVRKNLDACTREVLVDRIRVVSETGVPIDETVERGGEHFRAIVEPVFAPASRTLTALWAICARESAPLPPRPPVGALEWMIWDDGRIETVWDDGMFDLYEISRTGSASPTGDMNQWVNSLIAPEDRARMKLTIDAGIRQSNGKRYFVHYRIITRADTGNPGMKNLEVAASSLPDPVLPLRRLRAITREVPELIPAINPEFGDTGSIIHALFALSTDAVLAAVDVRRWQTFMTSDSWADFGIQEPRHGYLPHIIHPDDFDAFREAAQSEGTDPVRVRLLHKSGGYFPYEVATSNGQEATGNAEYVICRIKAIPSDS